MKYDLVIRRQNIQPHFDIENELQLKKNGLFTFVLRVNSGLIVDFSVLENINVKRDYLATTIIIEEFSIALSDNEWSASDPVRSDNF